MTSAGLACFKGGRLAVIGIASLLFFLMARAPAVAQSPPSFEIRLMPQAAPAVAGQPFSYTVIITNTGHSAPADILVTAPVPPGAVFQNTTYTHENWLAGGLEPGQSGHFAWFTRESVPPGAAIEFRLTVLVQPEARQLTFADYGVSTLADPAALFARGPAVTVPVAAAPPTSAPAPVPTFTPGPTSPAVVLPAPAVTASVKAETADDSFYAPVIIFGSLLLAAGFFILIKLARRA